VRGIKGRELRKQEEAREGERGGGGGEVRERVNYHPILLVFHHFGNWP
jgi:hypothetical protein